MLGGFERDGKDISHGLDLKKFRGDVDIAMEVGLDWRR